ncbi:hypothetical protein JCM9534A_23110 [Catenuloplanes indicus JCM 9534]
MPTFATRDARPNPRNHRSMFRAAPESDVGGAGVITDDWLTDANPTQRRRRVFTPVARVTGGVVCRCEPKYVTLA